MAWGSKKISWTWHGAQKNFLDMAWGSKKFLGHGMADKNFLDKTWNSKTKQNDYKKNLKDHLKKLS